MSGVMWLSSCVFIMVAAAYGVCSLLRPENTNLRVYEDAVMGAYVKDLSEVAVCTAEEAMRLLAKGNEYRHVSATAMNAKSSRSHTLFRMAVETRAGADDAQPVDTGDALSDTMSLFNHSDAGTESKMDEVSVASGARAAKKPSVKLSHLNLVDLAGSERVSKAQTTGSIFKEVRVYAHARGCWHGVMCVPCRVR